MPDTVWTARLDDRWDCKVVRTDQGDGLLTVSDATGWILRERVPLSYGAMFGPDVADVAEWQDKCAAAVDAHA